MYTLITAATSAQAYRLKNKLNAANVILGDYRDIPAVMITTGNMIRLPNPKSMAYAREMLTLCLDKQIDTIYVLGEDEFLTLMIAEQLFKEYGIVLADGR